jgi:excisionase family DNA binding protein
MTSGDARASEPAVRPTLDGVVRLPVRPDAAEPRQGFMSIDEVADYLGLSQRWVYEQVRAGRLPARLIARSWRLRRDEVDAFADSFIWMPDERSATVSAALSGRRAR